MDKELGEIRERRIVSVPTWGKAPGALRLGVLGVFGSGVQGPGAAAPPPPPGWRLRMVGWSGVSNCLRRGAGSRRRRERLPSLVLPESPVDPGSPASLRSLRRTSVSSPRVPLCSCPVSFCPSRSFCLSRTRLLFSPWVRSRRGCLVPRLPFLSLSPFPPPHSVCA